MRLPQYGSTWTEIRDAALRIEQLGFHGIWANDHLQSPGRLKHEPTFDALTTLAALAPLTTRPHLGIAVLSASYRPAALTAKMTTVLDVISGGRLIVGLGTGSDRAEHTAYGIPFQSPAQRTSTLINTLDVMQAMHDTPDGAMPNRPAARPPIWLAAHKPRLLRIAGERADGIVAAWTTPDEIAKRRMIAEDARQTTERPPLACCLYTFGVPLTPDTPAMLVREAAALDTTPAAIQRWLSTTGIVAPADEFRDRLEDYRVAGVTDIVFALPSRVPLEAYDALAAAVGVG